MKTPAAILVSTDLPLELVELKIPSLRPGQALVEISYSGVCHTQLLEARGGRGDDRFLPHCIGHEGSGIVVEIGQDVQKVKQGESVIMSWIKGNGADVPRSVYDWDGRDVNAGGVTTFSRFAVVAENRLTPLRDNVSMKDAALLGCAVPTGLGAVFNTAQAVPGQSIAVIGTGGIGLCAVAGATLAGCSPVIAVDLKAAKLDVARAVGATHVVDASKLNWVDEVARLCPGGLDVAIEATGQTAVMAEAMSLVRNQGGVVVVIGNAKNGAQLTFDPHLLNLGKRLFGTWGGDNKPERDFPRYARLVASGALQLAPLQSDCYSLSAVNDALDDLEGGRVIRPVIDLSLS